MGWFGYRRQEADQKLRLLHLDLLCRAVSHSTHMGGAAWRTQRHWFNMQYLLFTGCTILVERQARDRNCGFPVTSETMSCEWP